MMFAKKNKTTDELFSRCNERTNPGCQNPVTLDECMAIFRILQNDFYAEYKMYELETLAIALVFPIVCTFICLIV